VPRRIAVEQKQLLRYVTSNLAAALEEKAAKLFSILNRVPSLEVTAHTVQMRRTGPTSRRHRAHNAGQATTNVESLSGDKSLVASGRHVCFVRNSMKSDRSCVRVTRQADYRGPVSGRFAHKKSAINRKLIARSLRSKPAPLNATLKLLSVPPFRQGFAVVANEVTSLATETQGD